MVNRHVICHVRRYTGRHEVHPPSGQLSGGGRDRGRDGARHGRAGRGQRAKTKLLLDTDIGTDIDDAWALGYALKSPAIDMVGVTISDGDTAARARLACKLLHRLGRTDIPVSIGRPTAAIPPIAIDYQFAWAEDFQGYKPIETHAVKFLSDTIRKNPGQITLVAVGPLQNIGDLVRLHPDVVPMVKRVVLMSGTSARGANSPMRGTGVERQGRDS